MFSIPCPPRLVGMTVLLQICSSAVGTYVVIDIRLKKAILYRIVAIGRGELCRFTQSLSVIWRI